MLACRRRCTRRRRSVFVEMRVGSIEKFAALAQQSQPAGSPNPPPVGNNRVARRSVTSPATPAAVGLRHVAAQPQVRQRDQRWTPGQSGCTNSTCSAAMISVSGSVAESPSDASCTVTETMAPVSMSTRARPCGPCASDRPSCRAAGLLPIAMAVKCTRLDRSGRVRIPLTFATGCYADLVAWGGHARRRRSIRDRRHRLLRGVAERALECAQGTAVAEVEVAPDPRLLWGDGDDRYRPLVAAGQLEVDFPQVAQVLQVGHLVFGSEGSLGTSDRHGSLSRSRATVRGVDPESRPLRLTQARIGDTLHDGNGTRVAVVNAFTTVNPDTDAIVRAVDYHVVGSPEQFRVYSDDAGDVARWRRGNP